MTVLLLVVTVAIGVLAVAFVALRMRAAAEDRRQRRLALRRALVLQAADRQMRAASNAAVSALIDVVRDRHRPPGGDRRA